jgi:hypothetical protein
MVRAQIEMLQPVVEPSAPRSSQSDEPVASAREHEACSVQLGHAARQPHFLRARHKIDDTLKQVPR